MHIASDFKYTSFKLFGPVMDEWKLSVECAACSAGCTL